MKELLTYIINNIVNMPEKVKINLEQTDEESLFTVTLPKEEIGTVIGSGGKTIRAIKTLLSLKGKGKNFSLEIKEA
jgi:hypothetical protein